MATRRKAEDQQFIVATFDTRHFRFMSYGRTKQEAYSLLQKAWAKHVEQTGAQDDYLEEREDGVEYETVRLGIATRDHEIIAEA